MKTKFLRGNNQPHITKELRKAIMLRSKLKNKANRSKDPEDMTRLFRNLVVNMNRHSRKSVNDSMPVRSFQSAVFKYCCPLTKCFNSTIL